LRLRDPEGTETWLTQIWQIELLTQLTERLAIGLRHRRIERAECSPLVWVLQGGVMLGIIEMRHGFSFAVALCPAAPARSEGCLSRRTSSGCGAMRPRCPYVMSLTIVGGIPTGAGRFHARAKKLKKICCSLCCCRICGVQMSP